MEAVYVRQAPVVLPLVEVRLGITEIDPAPDLLPRTDWEGLQDTRFDSRCTRSPSMIPVLKFQDSVILLPGLLDKPKQPFVLPSE